MNDIFVITVSLLLIHVLLIGDLPVHLFPLKWLYTFNVLCLIKEAEVSWWSPLIER